MSVPTIPESDPRPRKRPGPTRGFHRGYRVLPSGACQVRVRGFPAETVGDEIKARLRVAELLEARQLGHDLPPPAGARQRTLGQEGESFLAEKRAIGGRNGPLSPKGDAHWELATRPWREGPLADRPLRLISRQELQQVINARALTNPTSGHNEAEALLAILNHAKSNDVVFAASLLAITVPRKPRKKKLDLEPAQFDYLISFCDDVRSARLLRLASTLANRITELFLMERSWVELDARRIIFPAEVVKEREPKVLDLFDDEVELLREQLLDVYAWLGTSTRYVFPKPGGGRWTKARSADGGMWSYSRFHERVWAPAKRRAMIACLTERGEPHPLEAVDRRLELQGQLRRCRDAALARELAELPATPFDSVTLHTLRKSAVGWLVKSGLQVQIVAQRLGHHDDGATLLRDYLVVHEGDVRAALDELGTGLRAALEDRNAG